MKPPRYMWISSCQKNELANSAEKGWTSTTLPSRSAKPPGWFIQPLTEMTNSEPAKPAMTTGIPDSRCIRGESRSQS